MSLELMEMTFAVQEKANYSAAASTKQIRYAPAGLASAFRAESEFSAVLTTTRSLPYATIRSKTHSATCALNANVSNQQPRHLECKHRATRVFVHKH